MPETVGDLVTELQGIVDVDDVAALRSINRRHRQIVSRARSRRDRVEIGPTVAGQAFYSTGLLVEVLAVSVNGVPYGMGRRGDDYGYAQGTLVWQGPGGLVIADASSGVQGLLLVPTPTVAGQSIEVYAARFPGDLAADTNVLLLSIDTDMLDVLVEAAAATFLRRQGEGDPDAIEARFLAACEELRERVQQRFRTTGPAQIRVIGVNV